MTSTLSVISSFRSPGTIPVSSSATATVASNPACANWRGDTLTDTASGGSPAVRHARSWRHASSKTQLPTPMINPLSSANPMKRTGASRPAVGWRQRTSASAPTSLPSVKAHLRLIHELELVTVDCVAQRALEREPLGGSLVHLQGEETHGVAPRGFGPVHRGVGASHQRVGAVAVGREQRAADAGADDQRFAAEHEWRAQCGCDLVRDPLGRRTTARAVEQHHELVAAPTRHRVALPHRGPQPLRHLSEQHVAFVVAEAVVHVLEAVEVDEEHGDTGARAARAGERLQQPVAQEEAVRQPGQRIVGGLVLDAFGHRGDVAQVGDG